MSEGSPSQRVMLPMQQKVMVKEGGGADSTIFHDLHVQQPEIFYTIEAGADDDVNDLSIDLDDLVFPET